MPIIRIIYIIIGSISLLLGIIGIFLPLVPTTPFLLLSALLYYKSSPKCYNWLISQPHLGKYIRNYREKKIIPRRVKITTLSFMWISMLYCAIFLLDNIVFQIGLVVIAIAVTIHILSYKSESN